MITIIRGDSKTFKFKRKNTSNEVITAKPDKMYITFKRNSVSKDVLFQKTLDDGIEYDSTTYYYSFTINPEDTDNLSYGVYDYDIEIITNNKKKTILVDKLKITKEVTFTENEV